uniref:Laminin EGF-like domain-containing protein n=1 Tax=Labrus bergylta TaxID=56723 RepID=A0A3Q3GRZ6_9LABR
YTVLYRMCSLLVAIFIPQCNCSGRSDDCVFDMEQYRSTGSGGRCVSCRDNTDGPHCERCKGNHYRKSAEEHCLCKCNPIGSTSVACHPITGQCVCNAGVEGRLCDSCRVGFFGFSSRGCRGTQLQASSVHCVHSSNPFNMHSNTAHTWRRL